MKKIFFSLALLTSFGAYAAEVSQIEQEAQIAQQEAFLQQLGDQLAAQLLQDPQNGQLLAWFNDASDYELEVFKKLCKRFATLNIVLNSQYNPLYKQLFAELTDLTGSGMWAVQISFVSDDLAQSQDALGDDGDDSDDSEGSSDFEDAE